MKKALLALTMVLPFRRARPGRQREEGKMAGVNPHVLLRSVREAVRRTLSLLPFLGALLVLTD